MELNNNQLFYIKQALFMYIDYLCDGDEDDKETAKKVGKLYEYIEENE